MKEGFLVYDLNLSCSFFMFSIEFFNDESNGEFDELLDFLFLSDGLGFDERFEDNFVVVWKYICV